jgi:hypothetical protein
MFGQAPWAGSSKLDAFPFPQFSNFTRGFRMASKNFQPLRRPPRNPELKGYQPKQDPMGCILSRCAIVQLSKIARGFRTGSKMKILRGGNRLRPRVRWREPPLDPQTTSPLLASGPRSSRRVNGAHVCGPPSRAQAHVFDRPTFDVQPN